MKRDLVISVIISYCFRIGLPGSGSDYASFRDRLGVPIVGLSYTFDVSKVV